MENNNNSSIGRCSVCGNESELIPFSNRLGCCDCFEVDFREKLNKEKPNQKYLNELNAKEFVKLLKAHFRNGGSLDDFDC